MHKACLWMLIDVQLENKAFRPHIRGLPIKQMALQRAEREDHDTADRNDAEPPLDFRLDAAPGLVWRTQPGATCSTSARLSDHLRRDMGFLDGNDPSGRHC